MDYKAYTTEFDEILRVSDARQGEGPLAHIYPSEPEIIMGSLATAISGLEKVFGPIESPETGVDPVFLLNCSGSCAGPEIQGVICAMLQAGDALHAAGREFEVLGYTTSGWKGGKSGEKWREAGKPPTPGRVSDLRHLIFKEKQEPWPEARNNLLILMSHYILKEEITGEALEWAAGRIDERGNSDALVMMSTDVPRCIETEYASGGDYLITHLTAVVGGIAERDVTFVAPSKYPMSSIDIGDISELREEFARFYYQARQTISKAIYLSREAEPDTPGM